MNVRHTSQRGFTLVELMIAVLLGLVILVVIGQIYLSGKRSYSTQTGFAGMQENGRFALYFLQRDSRVAGVPRMMGPGGAAPPAESFTAANSIDGGSGGNDQIEIQYNPFGSVLPSAGPNESFEASHQDCLGNGDKDTPPPVTNRYSVENGSLQCKGYANAASQPLISGVDSFQILYGVDSDDDGYADTYLRADQVANFQQVAAVRVGLLLNSQEKVFDTPDCTLSYAVLDQIITPSTNCDFARRVFTTTIQIRNRTQE